jgi:hypothetical protein
MGQHGSTPQSYGFFGAAAKEFAEQTFSEPRKEGIEGAEQTTRQAKAMLDFIRHMRRAFEPDSSQG